jgi:hypothetical protein
MPGLSEAQLGSVRLLIQTAPDTAIRDLEATLSSGSERHETMRMIQQMVTDEAADRRARNAVFSPLVALCGPKRETLRCLRFPGATIAQLWRGLKEAEPAAVQAATLAADQIQDPEGQPAAALDEASRLAAEGLRARSHPGYAAAAATLDNAMPQGAELFASYLDLVPVSRAALSRTHEWLGRLNDERIAAAKLTFKDATDVGEDAGPRLLEVVFAHLEEPWAILRMVSAVMHRPGDRYVANSELASFGDRLMDDIDDRLAVVSAFNTDGGVDAGMLAGRAVRIAALVIQEFDECVELSPEGPWGSRLTRQKRALAAAVEARLKGAEADVAAALPVQSGYKHRGTRGQPKLNGEPDWRMVNRARAVLTLMHEVRGSAERLGFGALWNKCAEQVQLRLDGYIEDLLEKLRSAEEDDNLERVRTFLDIAAEFMGLASDDKAAQIVRRRVAAAA